MYLKIELPNNQKTPKGEIGNSLTHFLSNEQVGGKSVRIQHKATITVLKNHLPTDWGQSSVVLTWYAEGHNSNNKIPT